MMYNVEVLVEQISLTELRWENHKTLQKYIDKAARLKFSAYEFFIVFNKNIFIILSFLFMESLK